MNTQRLVALLWQGFEPVDPYCPASVPPLHMTYSVKVDFNWNRTALIMRDRLSDYRLLDYRLLDHRLLDDNIYFHNQEIVYLFVVGCRSSM